MWFEFFTMIMYHFYNQEKKYNKNGFHFKKRANSMRHKERGRSEGPRHAWVGDKSASRPREQGLGKAVPAHGSTRGFGDLPLAHPSPRTATRWQIPTRAMEQASLLFPRVPQGLHRPEGHMHGAGKRPPSRRGRPLGMWSGVQEVGGRGSGARYRVYH